MFYETLEQTPWPEVRKESESIKKAQIEMYELLRTLPLSMFLKTNNLDTDAKKDALITRLIEAAKNPGDIVEGSESRSGNQKNLFLYHTVINNWLFWKTSSALESWSILLRAPNIEPTLYSDKKTFEAEYYKAISDYKAKINKIYADSRAQIDLMEDTWPVLPPLGEEDQKIFNKKVRVFEKSYQDLLESLIKKEASQWWAGPLSWWKQY